MSNESEGDLSQAPGGAPKKGRPKTGPPASPEATPAHGAAVHVPDDPTETIAETGPGVPPEASPKGKRKNSKLMYNRDKAYECLFYASKILERCDPPYANELFRLRQGQVDEARCTLSPADDGEPYSYCLVRQREVIPVHRLARVTVTGVGAVLSGLCAFLLVGVIVMLRSASSPPPAGSNEATTNVPGERDEKADGASKIETSLKRISDVGVKLTEASAKDVASRVVIPKPVPPTVAITNEQIDMISFAASVAVMANGPKASDIAGPVKQEVAGAIPRSFTMLPADRTALVAELKIAVGSVIPKHDAMKAEIKEAVTAAIAPTIERDVLIVVMHNRFLDARQYTNALRDVLKTERRGDDALVRVGLATATDAQVAERVKLTSADPFFPDIEEPQKEAGDIVDRLGPKIAELFGADPAKRRALTKRRVILVVSEDTEPGDASGNGWEEIGDVHVVILARKDQRKESDWARLGGWFAFTRRNHGSVQLIDSEHDPALGLRAAADEPKAEAVNKNRNQIIAFQKQLLVEDVKLLIRVPARE